jgi:ADP-dependent NAD(P)H-hydrate dehydratase / NAD(P)H-hydrate epimerase
MLPLLTADEMRALERASIQGWGISSLVLQEHAAVGALALLPADVPLTVLAGPGNNGGDALALARLARLRGQSVEVWTLDPQPVWRGDAALQAGLWEGLGGTYRHTHAPEEVVPRISGWVVDGLFGLGTRLPLTGLAEAWVRALGEASGPFRILALDLPTGLDPSSPDVHLPALQADVTACFGPLKVCHGLRPASTFCGEIRSISLPLRDTPTSALQLVERPRSPHAGPWDSHKRDFGHVAIRAGTPGMGGAAVLAALGALRAGAGLVTVLTDPGIRSELAAQVPEAMVRAWEGRVPEDVDVLLVGPGGVDEIPEWEGTLVLDASALRAGEGARWLARPATVLTPHPGEFGRLFGLPGALGHPTSIRLAKARAVATGPGILALKGAQSVVAGGGDPLVYVNPTGHRGLATGGSGDFLAGLVAARAARWHREFARGPAPDLGRLKRAVAEALWLHGAAADRLGPGPLLVRDLGPSLSDLLRELEREAH